MINIKASISLLPNVYNYKMRDNLVIGKKKVKNIYWTKSSRSIMNWIFIMIIFYFVNMFDIFLHFSQRVNLGNYSYISF